MTRVATGWLVYKLTGSAALLGIVSFAGQVPAFFLGPVAGVLVDRWDRRRTLIVTQVLSMLQSLAMAVLALAGVITTWEVLLLAVVQGVVNAFDMPARQSLLIRMVDRREDLGNAIALNSSMVHAARLIGPALAGITIALVGEGYCFLLDGISYVAVIVSLVMMSVTSSSVEAPVPARFREQFLDGWQYVAGSVAVRALLLLLAVVSFSSMAYAVLMPITATRILHGGPHTLGYLMAASGLGALLGAVELAARRSVLGLGKRIVLCCACAGVFLVAFGLSHSMWLSLLLLPLVGFGTMQNMAAINTILQTVVPDAKRGRVMSFYSMAFQGMTPFGSLVAGILAAKIGAAETVILSGVPCVLGALWFARQLPAIRVHLTPRYRELGILPLAVAETNSLRSNEGE